MENYKGLEFEEVKALVSEKASFSLGHKLIEEMEPSFSTLAVKRNLETVKQALDMTVGYGPMPFGGIYDISASVSLAAKDGTLTAQELLQVADQSYGIEEIIKYTKNATCEKERITDLVSSLNSFISTARSINGCIDRSGQVMDSASVKLKSIRASIRQTQGKIASVMNSFISRNSQYLQDTIIASRNDRNVILVKNTYKNSVKGLQYGTSASGMATYVEPAEAVEHNNRLSELNDEEKREIQRILFSLSQQIKQNASGYLANTATLGVLDSYFARAIWGRENDCVISQINDNYDLIIEKGRHPLIDRNKVVANSYHMISPVETLLITGPNTGGKTVSLKLIGLFALMHQCAIPLPAREASLPVYDNIFCDIGDNQSIADDLSTFSAHISNLAYITQHATNHSLVILDELGSGTDPVEGQALAASVLDYLRIKRVFTVATTHFAQLKAYGQQHSEIMTSSVQFDEENLRPTYVYQENTLGRSNALEIARRIGFKPEIIEKAYQFKADQQKPQDQLIENLQQQLDLVAQQREKLEAEKQQFLSEKQQLEADKRKLENDRIEVMDKARKDAYEMMENIRRESDEIIDELKAMESYRMNEVSKIKNRISNLAPEQEVRVIDDSSPLKIGDYVMISLTSQRGEIVEMDRKSAMVLCDGLKIRSSLNNLVRVERPKEKKKVSTKAKISRVSGGFKMECNLIGMRVEEAMEVLDKYMDNAIVSNAPFVRIIHGVGTGALRKAVWNRLGKYRFVKKFEIAPASDGGAGATLVTLGGAEKNAEK